MRWSRVIVATLGVGLLAGCQLLVSFETVPEGAGGKGGAGAGAPLTGGASTGGDSTGGASTGGSAGSTTGSTSQGGTTCTAECCSNADCAPADPCVAATCESGQCVLTPVPDGGDAAVQIQGDCKRLVCQSGVATSVTDTTDILDDGNDCTKDECSGSTPKTSTFNQDTTCVLPGGSAGVCNGKGKCVECTSNAHCADRAPKCEGAPDAGVCVSLACSNGTKDGTETDVDCGGPDCDPCNNGKVCATGADCESGVCAFQQCAQPTCMDGVLNGNEGDVDCGDNCPNDCDAGQHCNKGGDCKSGQCTGQGGVCLANCNDDIQNGTESAVDCGGGVCKPCGAGEACGGVDGNCLSGDCDPAGLCAQGAIGTQCSAAADCLSGHCADGYCCNSQCTGTCKSCKLAGTEGTCTNIPAGQDPQNECLNACNGNGACAP